MTIYSFWVFDRHCECIFSRDWKKQLAAKEVAGTQPLAHKTKQTTHQDDAKLVFGVAFSLRNMVRKLTDEDSFTSFKTSKYRLHFYETPTNLRFILITDPRTDNMTVVLKQIYVSLYVEYVVKNPLAPVEHPGGDGVANELFLLGLDAFITSLPGFD